MKRLGLIGWISLPLLLLTGCANQEAELQGGSEAGNPRALIGTVEEGTEQSLAALASHGEGCPADQLIATNTSAQTTTALQLVYSVQCVLIPYRAFKGKWHGDN